jgi:deoxyribonuclease V
MEHGWDVSPQEAVDVQRRLAGLVERHPRLGQVRRVAGVDVSIRDDMARAAVVVLSISALQLLDYAVAERTVAFPYVPGLLAFREGPVVMEALERVGNEPDLLIFDGHGLAHPRRLGIACHIGVLADIPAIGCAKSRLCGQHDEPGPEPGDYALLVDKGEVVGAALRTRVGANPVYVSIGHRVDLATSLEYVRACTRGYRLPEATRWAHRVAGGETPPSGGQQPSLFDV